MSPSGIVLVDKPTGWTSHDVVARMRRLAGTRKVGHAGTLDPMATGVLVLGVNAGTRLLRYLVGCDKTYEATIRLGMTTITDDAEGETVDVHGCDDLDDDRLQRAIAALTGEIEQVPSSVSAIKVDGKRSYARVRAGEEIDLPARPVTVHRFDLLGRQSVTVDGTAMVDIDVVVSCSSGTYIRALARDLGTALGVGGHLTSLRRTTVGPFTIDETTPLESITEGNVPMYSLAHVAQQLFPVRTLDEDETRELRFGRVISAQGVDGQGIFAAICVSDLVALVERRGDELKPVCVFPEEI